MKTLLTIFVSFLFSMSFYAQVAQNYFPAMPGHTWLFESTILDSNSNPIPETKFYRADSFAVTGNYYNRDANLVLTKFGPLELINTIPYFDSLFIGFDGDDDYEYFSFANLIDTTLIQDSLLIALLEQFEGWYSLYKFGSPVGQDYVIFQKDTTITIGSTSIPLQIIYSGKRLNDENLTTAIGDFLCKKFETNMVVNVPVLPPPVPPVEVVNLPDMVWIAEGNWIVREYRPSVETADLSLLGIPSILIPGLERDITEIPTSLALVTNNPADFSLEQNYPNPFNPVTTISFSLKNKEFVELKIYDILGRDLATLISGNFEAGTYTINFDGTGYSSGIYFYKIAAGTNFSVKKMILSK